MGEPLLEPSREAIILDAGRSPAQQIPPELLGGGGVVHGPYIRFGPGALACDRALMWLTASDRIVSDQVGRALIQVKEKRLHEREGHARWSSYLRAFVPLTPRWSQQLCKALHNCCYAKSRVMRSSRRMA